MRISLVILVLALGGCARVDATEAGGVARWWGIAPTPAIEEANKQCARSGRVARVTQIEALMHYLVYSCVRD